MVAAIRQIGTAGVLAGTTTVVMGLPILGGSVCAAFLNTRGQPSSWTRTGWTVDAGIIATAASANDQHMAGWAPAGTESGVSSLAFTDVAAGGGQFVVLELTGVGALRQWQTTRQTQNVQPCTLPLASNALDGSLILGFFCMRPPDGVGMTGTPDAGWTESLENTPSAGGLHPWDYVASRVAAGAGAYTPGVTSVYAWTGDFGAGYAGTALEFPAAGGSAFHGEPGGGYWAKRLDERLRRLWQGWARRPSGVLIPT